MSLFCEYHGPAAEKVLELVARRPAATCSPPAQNILDSLARPAAARRPGNYCHVSPSKRRCCATSNRKPYSCTTLT